MKSDREYMGLALRLAQRGLGATSPNPMVGAVLVRAGRILGRGWHHGAGAPHAEIEAFRNAQRRGARLRGATLYVTLEPCSTQGRTPPCTSAVLEAGIKRVVVGATDPNPKHQGRGFEILRSAGLEVVTGVLADECARLNEAFNHWIRHRLPWVTVKAAMTLDGKIATASGDSKWVTGARARAYGMELRRGADAILVGINTILADDPSLTYRPSSRSYGPQKRLRRIVLDARARTPLSAKVVSDQWAPLTTIVVSELAPKRRVAALAGRARVLVAPLLKSRAGAASRPPAALDLPWVLQRLGSEAVTSLLVEGGGEVNASFLFHGLAHLVVFFYAPKIIGGRDARKAVAGEGASARAEALRLSKMEWRKAGQDWWLTACVG